MYLWHKELFVFTFWRLSEDNVSKLKKLASFFKFQSISILGHKQDRIASVHFKGLWLTTALFCGLHWRKDFFLVFWSFIKIAWHCPFKFIKLHDHFALCYLENRFKEQFIKTNEWQLRKWLFPGQEGFRDFRWTGPTRKHVICKIL